MIAALYVDIKRGPYAAMPGVDAWGIERDATQYAGPWPVVAHPPCKSWGSLRHLALPNQAERDCGPRAVEQVRRWGGVLEQPAHSQLWAACGLPRPGELPDSFGGWSIEVRQCDFGHLARKRTWLYIVGCRPDCIPALPPAREPTHWVSGTYTPGKRGTVPTGIRVVPPRLRHLTPLAFAEWLVSISGRCEVSR